MTSDNAEGHIISKASRALTSYDLFKAAAVILMILDHVGYYFYPEQEWFRVFGRLCVPIWFFLIGYARSRDLTPPIWIGMGVLVVANVVAGLSVFPLNVLGTMILVRLTIDPVMRAAKRNAESLMVVSAILFALILPSYMVAEYGTQGIIMAMFGYIIRNQVTVPGIKTHQALASGFCLFTMLNFVGIQQLIFAFPTPQMLVMFVGILLVCSALYMFKPMEFPRLTAMIPGPITALLQFLGRYTLEIYVSHLLLFKAMAMYFDPARFQFMQWTLFWTGG